MPSFTKLSAIFLSLTLALSVSARPTQSTQPRSQSANKPGDRSQTRSMVITRGGIVAAESPLAAQVGAQILAHGGNAIDAIVATNAAIGVIEPMMNGIGGDLFAIVYDAKTKKLYGLNASGWAPKNLTIEFLKSKGIDKMPQIGINSVTVPGAVDGWAQLLSRFGTKKFPEVLAPAIELARNGFPVAEWDASYWSAEETFLKADKNLSSTYLIDGHAPKVGEVFHNPDLANSLDLIARGGRDAFYRGQLASRIVDFSKKQGGAMELGRSRRLLRRMGRTHLNRLPRLDRLRNSPQWPGHRRSRNAQHHGKFPSRPIHHYAGRKFRPALRRFLPHRHRSEKTRLR